MAEMRPAGLTQDGTALRLSDDSGAEHTLRITDELRSLLADGAGSPAAPGQASPHTDAPAVSADAAGPSTTTAAASASRPASRPGRSTRPGADAADEVPAAQVSPREIQSRIRAGATAEQVAEATGASLARVRIFEYPVLAERNWIAQQVQQLEVWVGGPDLYSSTVEDGGPSTLGALVVHRLSELGLDPESVTWDAWREGPGPWTVVADFSTDGLRSRPTQEQPPARFSFRQGGKHVEHVNRWAQLLADTESWNIGGGRSAADETPFDVEAGAAAEPEHEPVEPTALRPDAAPDPDEELLEILRARRGQRLGADEESDDALALMLTRDETPAPQTPQRPTLAAADDTGAGSAPTSEPAADQTEYLWDDEGADDAPLASVHAFRTSAADQDDRGADARDGQDSVSGDPEARPEGEDEKTVSETDSSDTTDSPAADAADPTGDTDGADDADAPAEQAPARPAKPQPTSGRGGSRGRIADVLIKDTSEPTPGTEKKSSRSKSSTRRASVPSWDEIVFGRKND